MIKKIFPPLKYISYLLWVPLILTVSFEIITFSDWIYEFNWDRNNISYRSNLANNELGQVSDQIKDYFKNDDEKINFILLSKIGKTTQPNKYKISINELKKYSSSIAQY